MSSGSQHSISASLSIRDGSVAERLAMFVDSLVVNGATDVMLKFKQKDLCTLLGTQRTTLVATLDKLAEQEIIEYDSNVLRVLDYYQLIDLLK